MQTSLGEQAYGSDQCFNCDCFPRSLGLQPFNDSCAYFGEPCAFPPPTGEGECPGVTQTDIDECEAIWGPGAWDPVFCMCRNPNTPLIVDVDGNGFDLTSSSDGVSFDFRGGGSPVQTGWTSAGSDDAFLVLDRNGNGRIDDGTELFGNFTPQPPSSVPNGFAALERYDLRANGGDGDGRITAADPIFRDLRLWVDQNHDGRSQRRELLSLKSAGVESLGLRYHESRRGDEHGNQFRFFSRVRMDDHGLRFMADVFFAGADARTRACRRQ